MPRFAAFGIVQDRRCAHLREPAARGGGGSEECETLHALSNGKIAAEIAVGDELDA